LEIEKKYNRLKRIILISSLLALIIVVVLTILFGDRNYSNWGRDVFRISIQFLLIGVLGGILSLLFKRYSDYRTIRNNLWQKENEFVKDLIENYNNVKLVRRTMRGVSRILIDDEYYINRNQYSKLIRELNEGQLAFERAKRILNIEKDFFGNQRRNIRRSLKSIEKILNGINKEYEEKLPQLTVDLIPIQKLPRLERFLSSSNIFPFWRAVSKLNNLFRSRFEERENKV